MKELPPEFENEFEINTDLKYILKRGEPILCYDYDEDKWQVEKVSSFTGHSIGNIYNIFNDRYICIIKREKPLTPEEKIKQVKNKARKFVDEYIKNPTEEKYNKFELAFLRNDKTGL